MFSFSNRQPKLTFRSLLPNYLKDLHGCYSSWIYHYYFEGLNKTAHTILGLPVYPYNRMVDTSICCLYFVSSFEPLDFGILSWDWQTSKIHPGESPPAEIYTLTRSLEVRSRWKLGSAVDLNGIMMINGYEFRDLFWLGWCCFVCRIILEYGGLTAFTSLRLGNFLRWAATSTGFATSLETTFTAQKPCETLRFCWHFCERRFTDASEMLAWWTWWSNHCYLMLFVPGT